MFFYPTGPKSSQTGCCHLRNQEGVTQFWTCLALQGAQPGWGGGRFDSATSHIVYDAIELQQHKKTHKIVVLIVQ
jgi:hypothetical protein